MIVFLKKIRVELEREHKKIVISCMCYGMQTLKNVTSCMCYGIRFMQVCKIHLHEYQKCK